MTDVPEYIIRAERVFVDWSIRGPVDCMPEDDDRTAEQRLRAFEAELQYHLGCWTASMHICNSLYKIEGIDDRYYDDHHPPWIEEAIEYKKKLQAEVEEE